MRVAAGPSAPRRVRDVARVRVLQDVAVPRRGGESGGGQGLPSSASPPWKLAPQPHRHFPAVRTLTSTNDRQNNVCLSGIVLAFRCYLVPRDVHAVHSYRLQSQDGGRLGAGEEGACQDSRSAELHPIGGLPAQRQPHSVRSHS